MSPVVRTYLYVVYQLLDLLYPTSSELPNMVSNLTIAWSSQIRIWCKTYPFPSSKDAENTSTPPKRTRHICWSRLWSLTYLIVSIASLRRGWGARVVLSIRQSGSLSFAALINSQFLCPLSFGWWMVVFQFFVLSLFFFHSPLFRWRWSVISLVFPTSQPSSPSCSLSWRSVWRLPIPH